jgi:hypothetical protein
VTGTPTVRGLSTEKPPVFEETRYQPDLHRNGKGLEAPRREVAVALFLHRVQITPITGTSGTEALLRSRNGVAATKVVVPREEDHHAGAGTVGGKTVVVQTSLVQEGLGHRFMNEGFILRPIDGLVPLVVTITAIMGLTIDRTHGTPYDLQPQDTLSHLAGQDVIQR